MKGSTIGIIDDLALRYPVLANMVGKVQNSVTLIIDSFHGGGKVLVAGNGGSAADAWHIVGELMKSFKMVRTLPAEERVYSDELNTALERAVPAISLAWDGAFLTAWGNDNDPAYAFAQQVHALGKPGDIFIAITTSGNSDNILRAAEVAQAKNMAVIALTGQGGGQLAAYADVLLAAPETETYKVQELHLPIYHALCAGVENELFGE